MNSRASNVEHVVSTIFDALIFLNLRKAPKIDQKSSHNQQNNFNMFWKMK